jgi:hypothetical protein
MDRREILNELAQIVAITDGKNVSATVAYCPEAAQRARGLIQVVESWPTAFPPAPFVSYQCAKRHHEDCQPGSANAPFSKLCKCACHCQPEAPQQPAAAQRQVTCTCKEKPPNWPRVHEHGCASVRRCSACGEQINQCKCFAGKSGFSPEAPQQPAGPAPAPQRHIDTPDELLELLAGISSDPQIEGLSLAQKASTMALLYAAKALQSIEEMQRTALNYVMKSTSEMHLNPRSYSRRRHYRVDHEEYPQEPPTNAPSFDALAGEHTAAWESWAQELPGLARKFAWMLINASNRAGMPTPPVQSPDSPQEPS